LSVLARGVVEGEGVSLSSLVFSWAFLFFWLVKLCVAAL
jgi:hypothetical protein